MVTQQSQSSKKARFRHLVIQWLAGEEQCLVYARGADLQQVGTFSSREELRTGRAFPLEDGSLLHVQAHGPILQVTKNGNSLASIPAPAGELVDTKTLKLANSAASVVAAVGVITFIAGLLSFWIPALSLSPVLEFVLGALFIGLSVLTYRHSFIALLGAIVLYSLDAISLLVALVLTGSFSFVGIMIHIVFLVSMIRGIAPVRAIQKAKAENRANNHILCFREGT